MSEIPAWLISHRGDVDAAPENTLVALEAARLAGARRFEVDIQFTRDAVPVLLHDAALARLSGRSVQIHDLDWSRLSGLAVAEPWRRRAGDAGQPVTRLDDLVAWLRSHPGLQVFVECKPDALRQHGRQRVLDTLGNVLGPVLGQTVLISFDANLLVDAAKAGFAGRGWILRQWLPAGRARAEALTPDWLFVNWRKRLPGSLLWPGPWRWVAYEAGDAARARRLFHQGFAAVETMHYTRVVAQLGGSS